MPRGRDFNVQMRVLPRGPARRGGAPAARGHARRGKALHVHPVREKLQEENDNGKFF